MEKRLYRSQTNRVILGICGGLGEYFSIDPVIMRVVVVLVIIATSVVPGLLAYFILGLIIPVRGSPSATPRDNLKENLEEIRNATNKIGENLRSTFSGGAQPAGSGNPNQSPSGQTRSGNTGLLILGIIITVIGLASLFWIAFGWVFRYLWPAVLVVAGVLIIVAVVSRKS